MAAGVVLAIFDDSNAFAPTEHIQTRVSAIDNGRHRVDQATPDAADLKQILSRISP
jgi:hypothetical protein